MCSRVTRLNILLCLNTRESSLKALANVFEGLDFLLLITANRIKPLVASYQRYRHLDLWIPEAHPNFERNLISFVLQSP